VQVEKCSVSEMKKQVNQADARNDACQRKAMNLTREEAKCRADEAKSKLSAAKCNSSKAEFIE